MRRDRLTLPALFAGVACLCLAGSAHAAGKVSVEIGRAEFAGLVIEDAELDWNPAGATTGRVGARAARIRGIGATGPLAGFQFDCPALRIAGDSLSCNRGRLRGRLGVLGAQDTALSARMTADGDLEARLESVSLASGRATLEFRLADSMWQAKVELQDADLAGLSALAKPWLALPEGFSLAGSATGTVRANGRSGNVAAFETDLAVTALAFANAEGSLAGESIAGLVRAALTTRGSGFDVSGGHIALSAGQAYFDPLFLDFGVHPAALDFAGHLDTEALRFAASSFEFRHQGVMQAGGSAILDFAGESPLAEAQLRIDGLALESAAPSYLQPFLIDTPFKNIAGAGSVSGDLEVAGGLPVRVALEISDVVLDSPSGALSVTGLRGVLRWYDDALRSRLAGTIDDALFQSRVSWDAAGIWGLEIGAVDLPFATTGRHFRLLEPKLLPIFDGGLAIETLRIRHAGTPQMYLRFDAELEPISVAPLARAFGWPEFQGTLSGSIPELQLLQGVVTLGGNLEASVFDGRVVIRELQLREPLGKFPRMNASIDFTNLDLRLLTNTFSFGMITGRLSGRIEDLETFDWMPVAFDARLDTPPGDRSKHRISQRAVTNLSSIGGGSGGGVAAALQGGLLKFFDDFGYDRLGLSCILANDVCRMGGVEKAGSGYYIVKGKGLPRIDVIGSQTRVAWTRLVRQLGSIMESEIVVE